MITKIAEIKTVFSFGYAIDISNGVQNIYSWKVRCEMQVLIDVPDEEYEAIKNCTRCTNWFAYLIKKGTPLPKGHGRLVIVSEDKLKENQINLDFSCQKWISEVGLSNATLRIIEADKPESEDKE